MVGRSGGRPSAARPARRPPAERSSPASSGRTGVPVTTARGISVPSKATAFAAAKRPKRPLTAPGTASVLTETTGTRVTSAATPAGKLAYPPTITTTRGRRRANEATARPHAHNRPSTAPTFATSAAGLKLRWIPRPGNNVKGNSSVGHSEASWPRREPYNSTVLGSWPRATMARATCRDGTTWPPVPPPAMTVPRPALTDPGGSRRRAACWRRPARPVSPR